MATSRNHPNQRRAFLQAAAATALLGSIPLAALAQTAPSAARGSRPGMK